MYINSVLSRKLQKQSFKMDRDSTFWSINSSSSSFLNSQSSQLQHPHQEISLETPDDGSYTSDSDYDDGFSTDSSFDFPVVSLSQLDARRYVYSNGVGRVLQLL